MEPVDTAGDGTDMGELRESKMTDGSTLALFK